MWDTASPDVAPALAIPMGQIENAFRRLTGLVQDMPQEALDYRGPDGNLNSTAMLIRHLARVDLEYLHAIMGRPIPPEAEAAYGPYHDATGQIPLVAGRPAAELLGQYQQVIDWVREYLRTQPDSEATREVAIPWWSQPATVRYVLWHMAAHSMFHQGHISRLKAWYSRRSGG